MVRCRLPGFQLNCERSLADACAPVIHMNKELVVTADNVQLKCEIMKDDHLLLWLTGVVQLTAFRLNAHSRAISLKSHFKPTWTRWDDDEYLCRLRDTINTSCFSMYHVAKPFITLRHICYTKCNRKWVKYKIKPWARQSVKSHRLLFLCHTISRSCICSHSCKLLV